MASGDATVRFRTPRTVAHPVEDDGHAVDGLDPGRSRSTSLPSGQVRGATSRGRCRPTRRRDACSRRSGLNPRSSLRHVPGGRSQTRRPTRGGPQASRCRGQPPLRAPDLPPMPTLALLTVAHVATRATVSNASGSELTRAARNYRGRPRTTESGAELPRATPNHRERRETTAGNSEPPRAPRNHPGDPRTRVREIAHTGTREVSRAPGPRRRRAAARPDA